VISLREFPGRRRLGHE